MLWRCYGHISPAVTWRTTHSIFPQAAPKPGRKPKKMQFLAPPPEVYHQGDFERCVIGQVYMPDTIQNAPPLKQQDIAYDKIFTDLTSASYGLFGSHTDEYIRAAAARPTADLQIVAVLTRSMTNL
jgi:hypothetical protein